jgi:uncharacterized protein YndB with AHSA1/START domain
MTTPISETQTRRSIDLKVSIDAPTAAVWDALTDPAQLANWFPPISSGSSAVGGKLLISWGPSMEWTTTVVAAEPNRHVRWVDDPSQPLAVDWTIDGRGGKTVVRLVHSGWSAESTWDDQFDATNAGWSYFLFNLRHYLERHRGVRRAMVSERRPTTMSHAALWERLTGPEGFAVSAVGHAKVRAGDRARIQLGRDPQRLDIAHCVAPKHLWGTLPGLSDAVLFIEMEPGNPGYHCGVWISTYGLSEERVKELREATAEIVEHIFGRQ